MVAAKRWREEDEGLKRKDPENRKCCSRTVPKQGRLRRIGRYDFNSPKVVWWRIRKKREIKRMKCWTETVSWWGDPGLFNGRGCLSKGFAGPKFINEGGGGGEEGDAGGGREEGGIRGSNNDERETWGLGYNSSNKILPESNRKANALKLT